MDRGLADLTDPVLQTVKICAEHGGRSLVLVGDADHEDAAADGERGQVLCELEVGLLRRGWHSLFPLDPLRLVEQPGRQGSLDGLPAASQEPGLLRADVERSRVCAGIRVGHLTILPGCRSSSARQCETRGLVSSSTLAAICSSLNCSL